VSKTPIEKNDMLPEQSQGQGAVIATGIFTVFLGGTVWHFIGIDERRVNSPLCKIDEFRMFVAPSSAMYGIQTYQKHDSRPWGHETNIARVKGGRGYITTKCYRKASRSVEPVPNVEDYQVHLIPRCEKCNSAHFPGINILCRESGSMGIFYDPATPVACTAYIETTSGEVFVEHIKSKFTYDQLKVRRPD
jgi:hypothetical protein